jgi:hypothetical protein
MPLCAPISIHHASQPTRNSHSATGSPLAPRRSGLAHQSVSRRPARTRMQSLDRRKRRRESLTNGQATVAMPAMPSFSDSRVAPSFPFRLGFGALRRDSAQGFGTAAQGFGAGIRDCRAGIPRRDSGLSRRDSAQGFGTVAQGFGTVAQGFGVCGPRGSGPAESSVALRCFLGRAPRRDGRGRGHSVRAKRKRFAAKPSGHRACARC